MEKESSISLGGTIILLALFAQRDIFGLMPKIPTGRKRTPLYENKTKPEKANGDYLPLFVINSTTKNMFIFLQCLRKIRNVSLLGITQYIYCH